MVAPVALEHCSKVSSSAAPSRHGGLDALKGLLIVLVILGHIPAASVGESFFKFAIYSIHMPLFLAVSGYMLSEDSLRNVRWGDLLRKHSRRMWIPWGTAFVAFFCWEHRRHLDAPRRLLTEISGDLLYPYHHLWYIPALGLMIYVLRLAMRCRVPVWSLLACSLVVTSAGMIAVGGIAGDVVHGPPVLAPLGDKRLVLWFVFFLLGFWIRNANRDGRTSSIVWIVGLAAYFAQLSTFWLGTGSWAGMLFVVTNVCLIPAVLAVFTRRPALMLPVVNWMGRDSLAIYLWHPLLLLPLREYFEHRGSPALYTPTAVIVVCLVFLPTVYVLGRIEPIGRLLFGAGGPQMRTVQVG